jgi:Leucine-rich repeat (LRR) protein
MLVLSFYGNLKISYLPLNVGDVYPNMRSYPVNYCSVKSIRKENFKGLNKLTHLGLNRNQIERIMSNTFDGLKSLERLELGKGSPRLFMESLK